MKENVIFSEDTQFSTDSLDSKRFWKFINLVLDYQSGIMIIFIISQRKTENSTYRAPNLWLISAKISSFFPTEEIYTVWKRSCSLRNKRFRKRKTQLFQNFKNYQNRFIFEKVTKDYVSDSHHENSNPFGACMNRRCQDMHALEERRKGEYFNVESQIHNPS